MEIGQTTQSPEVHPWLPIHKHVSSSLDLNETRCPKLKASVGARLYLGIQLYPATRVIYLVLNHNTGAIGKSETGNFIYFHVFVRGQFPLFVTSRPREFMLRQLTFLSFHFMPLAF